MTEWKITPNSRTRKAAICSWKSRSSRESPSLQNSTSQLFVTVFFPSASRAPDKSAGVGWRASEMTSPSSRDSCTWPPGPPATMSSTWALRGLPARYLPSTTVAVTKSTKKMTMTEVSARAGGHEYSAQPPVTAWFKKSASRLLQNRHLIDIHPPHSIIRRTSNASCGPDLVVRRIQKVHERRGDDDAGAKIAGKEIHIEWDAQTGNALREHGEHGCGRRDDEDDEKSCYA